MTPEEIKGLAAEINAMITPADLAQIGVLTIAAENMAPPPYRRLIDYMNAISGHCREQEDRIKALSSEVETEKQLREEARNHALHCQRETNAAEAERDALRAEVENLKTIIRAYSVGVVASAREAALAQAGSESKPAAQNGGATA